MSSQVIFYEKSKSDFEKDAVSVSASESDGTAKFMIDRSNQTAWKTNGSSDSAGTNFTVDMTESQTIDTILLLKHNFKSFTIQYFDNDTGTFKNFSPAINESNNSDDSTKFEFDAVVTPKIKVTINGTQTPDDDKHLFQFIATELIGQLNGWPVIEPEIDRDISAGEMLSRRKRIRQAKGAYNASLQVKVWKDSSDLDIVETLFNKSEGFLFWPGGGDEAQFSSVREGWRKEDIFLVRMTNPYSPTFFKGIYVSGIENLTLDLVEVVT